ERDGRSGPSRSGSEGTSSVPCLARALVPLRTRTSDCRGRLRAGQRSPSGECTFGAVGSEIRNLIDGRRAEAAGGGRFEKLRPADGSVLCTAPRSDEPDVAAAIAAARSAQREWAARTPV